MFPKEFHRILILQVLIGGVQGMKKLFAWSNELWKCSMRPGTKFNKFLIVGRLTTFNTVNWGSQEEGYNFQGFQTAFIMENIFQSAT